jgi:hypothetical protein
LAADGAGHFVAGCGILAHCVLMHATADSGLDVDQPTPASAPPLASPPMASDAPDG